MIQYENFQKEKLIISLAWANIFGLLILIPIILIYGIPYFLIWGGQISTSSFGKAIDNFDFSFLTKGSIIFLSLIVGIVIHELIHGMVWSIYAKKGFRSIKFGVIWKMLTPYCHCKEPLLVKHYILGAIMPALILGLFPAIYALIVGNIVWLIFGIFFTMAAAGDFLIVNLLIKENWNDLVQDHPSEAGCYIYRKQEM
jgi:hypothetical protein